MISRIAILPRFQHLCFRIVLGILMISGTACEAAARDQRPAVRIPIREECPYPIQGTVPRGKTGGLISIPGNPLPPLPEDSIKDAILIYRPILSAWRLLHGEDVSLARGLGYLASLYDAVGDITESERLYDQAQKILEKEGAAGRDLGWIHNNRGLARLNQRRYADALRSFRIAARALRTESQELEPRAIVLQNLASVEHILGDIESSEDAYLESLDLLRRLGRSSDRTFQTASQNLAELYASMGDFTASRKILEAILAQGPRDSSLRFAILNNLGETLRSLKEYGLAERRFEEARALTSEGSSQRALVLANIANNALASGQVEKAKQAGEEALRLSEALDGRESDPAIAVKTMLGTIALARGDLAGADRSLTWAKATLSKNREGHWQALAGVTQELTLVAQRQGNQSRALALGREAFDLESGELGKILAFGSEAQRLAYQSNAFPYDYLANLGAPELLAEAVLRMKGAVLDSLLTERVLARRSADPEDQRRLDRIHELKVAVMEEIGREGGGARLEELERSLKQEETALAKSLRRPVAGEPSGARLGRVQASLDCDKALLEFLRFQRYEDGGKLVPYYGAIVIPHQGNPSWISLGKADDLESSIKFLVQLMESRSSASWQETETKKALRELYDRLWRPLVAAFPNQARKILVSPDGFLHFVPWATLLDENGQFVAERWRISQVGTGRDLVNEAGESPDKMLLALADGNGDLGSARKEADSLAAIAKRGNWGARVLLGEEASETSLFNAHSPGILHLATHGRQLRGDTEEAIATRLSRLPMYRGYLVLGGAEKSLAAWRRGSNIPFSEDGILTAEEIGGLDLGRTWLTVLSACETGRGEARSGEGILGLRRGFALAGTRYLLFTLWSVADEPTEQFMESFYEKLFQVMDPDRAFYETQLAELHRIKQEQGVAEAVFQAGGLVLTR